MTESNLLEISERYILENRDLQREIESLKAQLGAALARLDVLKPQTEGRLESRP